MNRNEIIEAIKIGAHLNGAYLYGAHLSGADLSGADLSWADLSWADLSGADLSWADLSGADLNGAYLNGAYLSGADLSGADLNGAYLSGADLSGADLSGADLSGADLYGVIIENETLTTEPTVIAGLRWPILITNGYMRIGCQRYTHAEWESFNPKRIKNMDRGATDFWNIWRRSLLAECARVATLAIELRHKP